MNKLQSVAFVLCASLAAPALAAAQQELFELNASDGLAGDQFGRSVAISGPRAIVGAVPYFSSLVPSGPVYVFDVTSGQELLMLTASDGVPGDLFGISVGLSGNRAIVGAPGPYGLFSSGPGSAYVYDVQSGQELYKFTSSNVLSSELGHSVAISGDRAVVGAPSNNDTFNGTGVAYIIDVATGQELFELSPPVPQRFGDSVGIHGDLAIVGGLANFGFGSYSAAYVYSVTTGQQLLELTPSDVPAGFQFGEAVAIGSGHAVVGRSDGDGVVPGAGAVYVFDVSTGQELFKLMASDGAAGDRFGQSVALCGERLLIGAIFDDDLGLESGSVYAFDVTTGQELYKLNASDGAADDWFGGHPVSGIGIALSGERAIIGAAGADDLGAGSGSAYVFSIPATPISAFCFGDGTGSACPCANPGAPGAGCAHASGSSGVLAAIGSSSAAADDLSLVADLPPLQPALLFVGTNALNGGNGVPFGDGLRCVGGSVVRLGIVTPNAGGNATWGPGLGAQGGWSPGDTRHFQTWYRDPTGPCSSGFNLTNAVSVTFCL